MAHSTKQANKESCQEIRQIDPIIRLINKTLTENGIANRITNTATNDTRYYIQLNYHYPIYIDHYPGLIYIVIVSNLDLALNTSDPQLLDKIIQHVNGIVSTDKSAPVK